MLVSKQFHPRADRKLLKEVSKNTKLPSLDLKQALAPVDVQSLFDCRGMAFNKVNLPVRCARRKLLLSKRNVKVRLKFARENVDGNNVLWTDLSKM